MSDRTLAEVNADKQIIKERIWNNLVSNADPADIETIAFQKAYEQALKSDTQFTELSKEAAIIIARIREQREDAELEKALL